MRGFDFSSWQNLLLTLIVLALFTLISMGVRLLMMFTVQQRRERMNRQINERLRTLIAAYKILGGSFTGDLAVDPRHWRDVKRRGEPADVGVTSGESDQSADVGSERRRRIRDAVEGALSDIILLGTEEQVRLAERAARELVAGSPVHVDELVVSLRKFIRESLDLAPISADLHIPKQGPTRPSGSGARGKSERGNQGSRGGGGAMGGAGAGGGMGVGYGAGGPDDTADRSP